ncbi:MAG TPA: glycosyltransferase family 39 protein [Ktedonobacterales bacterium]|nr:glycosyltransferase family 39 protein [Ktedonobacterales bacterium]
MSSPLDIYLAMPFTLGGVHPRAAVFSVAIWNILGLAFCYVFVLRSFGRRVAALATFLLATCAAAVDYSRFLWQLNYIVPLLALWAITLYAGCVHGKRHWLIPNVTLLALVTLLHPTAAMLAPVLIVALALTPTRPKFFEYVGAAGVLLFFLIPNLIWEVLSRGSDFSTLGSYGSQAGSTDGAALYRVYELLSGPITTLRPLKPPHSLSGTARLLTATPINTVFSPSSTYAQVAPYMVALALVALAMFAIGWVILTVRVVRPCQALWRDLHGQESTLARVRCVVREVRLDIRWRANLLLWLCVTLPPLLTLHHSGPVYPHYLLIMSPFIFVVSAIGGCWLVARASSAAVFRGAITGVQLSSIPIQRYVALAALSVFVTAQFAQSALYVQALASGQIDASASGYGYLLKDLQAADNRLMRLQKTDGARQVFVTTTPDTAAGLTSILVGERADRIAFDQNCLVLPAPTQGPAIVAATYGEGANAKFLRTLPNAVHVANIQMPGTEPMVAYRVDGQTPALADETAVAPATFAMANGSGLKLDAIALTDAHTLRLRWTVLRDSETAGMITAYRGLARVLHADGTVTHPAAFDDCATQRWQAGETLFTWMAMPSHVSGDTLLVSLQTYTQGYDYFGVGPFKAVAGATIRSAFSAPRLTTSAPHIYDLPSIGPELWYSIPVSAVRH